MSAYSDWKCGALTDEEYRSHCEWEERRDRYLYEKQFEEEEEVDDEE